VINIRKVNMLFEDYMDLLENFPFHLLSRNNLCSFLLGIVLPQEFFRNTQGNHCLEKLVGCFQWKYWAWG